MESDMREIENTLQKHNVIRFGRDMKKYFGYAVCFARAELRSEVADSCLNWLWWLVEPLCMMVLHTVIFGYIFQVSEKNFPVFIFIGLIMWRFFSKGVSGSVTVIKKNKKIIQKVYLPKYILLIVNLLVNGFKMLASFAVVLPMMLAYQVPFSRKMVFFVPVSLVLFLLTFGVGSILMHYGVFVGDLPHVIEILLRMSMYLTGIFYSVSKRVPEPFGELLEKWNPLAFLTASMRNALLYGSCPDFEFLAVWTFISMILAAIGVFIIYHNENAYARMI